MAKRCAGCGLISGESETACRRCAAPFVAPVPDASPYRTKGEVPPEPPSVVVEPEANKSTPLRLLLDARNALFAATAFWVVTAIVLNVRTLSKPRSIIIDYYGEHRTPLSARELWILALPWVFTVMLFTGAQLIGAGKRIGASIAAIPMIGMIILFPIGTAISVYCIIRVSLAFRENAFERAADDELLPVPDAAPRREPHPVSTRTSRQSSPTLATVFEMHLGRSLEKLLAMAENFPDRQVTDMDPGEAALTLNGTRVSMQFLGGMMNKTGSWYWADEEDVKNGFVPARAVVASKRVQALGKTLGIPVLGDQNAGPIHIDVVTIIAMGVGELSGRIPFPAEQDATLWFGLESGAVPVPRPDALRMSRVMTTAMRSQEIIRFDPIAAFRHYATSYGMKLRDVPGGIEAEVAPNQTCGAIIEKPEPELARALGPGAVGYSFPVSLDRD